MKKSHFNLLRLMVLTLILLGQTPLFAQGRMQEKREQIKSLKVAFITEELKLTATEAEKFWPLFNTYDARQQELRQQKLKSYLNRASDESLDKMTEKEATAYLAQIESTDDEIYQNRKTFIASLKKILPATKIIRLRKTEEDFNRKLLRQYREKN